jgi:hypothetical protein
MPLLVGAGLTPSPHPDNPTVPVWVEDAGSIYATWTDPLGQQWQLSNTDDHLGYFTTDAIAGWGAVPVEIITDPLSRGGEDVRHIRAEPRRLTWPLHIFGDDHLQFLTRYRNLLRAFTATTHRRTPGVLRVARPDGTAREIEAFYEDGFGGEAGENWLFANPVLTLFCPDGYWRAAEPTIIPRTNAPGRPYLRRYPQVSSAQVLGAFTATNPGEVDAWPTWTITGPATKVIAVNTDAGGAFTLTHDLPPGETITITTNRPTVRGPGGRNLTDALDWPGAMLWPLVPGTNQVDVQIHGAGPGSGFTLTFHARFEGA